ncbi:hypothetical protein MTR67_002633 [Solanum verrucosum]|uniref:Uncharacterized protein n=1 Tax=Solanum verrucosum TaxID=315347 RepID=A0AAF0T9L2_SOLVR|nr:hypothetical protein MTR67_002633 [Solanum verrucosum]
MGSVAHVEEERRELVKYVHRLARLGVHRMSISDGGVTIQNGAESSPVVEVKEKKDSDPILLELKGPVHNHRVKVVGQSIDRRSDPYNLGARNEGLRTRQGHYDAESIK